VPGFWKAMLSKQGASLFVRRLQAASVTEDQRPPQLDGRAEAARSGKMTVPNRNHAAGHRLFLLYGPCHGDATPLTACSVCTVFCAPLASR